MLPLGPGVNDMLALFRAVGGTDIFVITGLNGNSGNENKTNLKI